jgi:hypothetical protein
MPPRVPRPVVGFLLTAPLRGELMCYHEEHKTEGDYFYRTSGESDGLWEVRKSSCQV